MEQNRFAAAFKQNARGLAYILSGGLPIPDVLLYAPEVGLTGIIVLSRTGSAQASSLVGSLKSGMVMMNVSEYTRLSACNCCRL